MLSHCSISDLQISFSNVQLLIFPFDFEKLLEVWDCVCVIKCIHEFSSKTKFGLQFCLLEQTAATVIVRAIFLCFDPLRSTCLGDGKFANGVWWACGGGCWTSQPNFSQVSCSPQLAAALPDSYPVRFPIISNYLGDWVSAKCLAVCLCTKSSTPLSLEQQQSHFTS